MSFRVVFSARSDHDLSEIKAFIARESASPDTARNLISKLYLACLSLQDFPECFPFPVCNFRHRLMPVGNYLVFYEIFGDDVVILHIRHAARKPFTK
ncbi:MAG: type II toxin-antitoxin system RelE/ParE family toxin [Terrimicrobiaceae bacterium]